MPSLLVSRLRAAGPAGNVFRFPTGLYDVQCIERDILLHRHANRDADPCGGGGVCGDAVGGGGRGGGVGGGREGKGDECVLYWGFDGADAWAGVGGVAGSEVGVEGYALVVDGLRRAHPRVDSGVLARHWEKKRCISGCIGGEAAFETATLVFWKRGIAGLYVGRCGHAPLAYRLLPTLSSHSHSDIPRQHHLSRRQGDPDQYPAVIRQRAVQFLRSNNRTVVSPVLNRPDRGQSRRRQVVGLRHAPNSRRVRSTRWPRRNGVHAGRPHQRECSGGYTDVPGSVDLVRMDYRQKGDVGCTGMRLLLRYNCIPCPLSANAYAAHRWSVFLA